MPPTGASYPSEQGHFTVTFDRRWKLRQSNALTVTVQEIDEPLILAVLMQYPESPTRRKPVMEDRFEELYGIMLVYGVSPDVRNAQIVFSSEASAYHFVNLRVLMTSQIDFYTLERAEKGLKGGWYTVYSSDVPRQQTVLLPEGELLIDYDPGTAKIIIPHSNETFFKYTPHDAIVDTLTLPGKAILDLEKRK